MILEIAEHLFVADMRPQSGEAWNALFFHLMDENEFLSDTLGVEVRQLDEVESAAIEMVREFRSQHAYRQEELRNWKLAVTDSDGRIVVVIPLFPSAPDVR